MEADTGSLEYEEQVWHKLDKSVDIRGESPRSWSLYHEYLYIHKAAENKRFNIPRKAIVDIAIGEPGSSHPPYYVVKDLEALDGKPKSRFDVAKNNDSWKLKHDVIWVKYDKSNSDNAIQDLMILFGEDVIEPRSDWKLCSGTLKANLKHLIRLTARRNTANSHTDKQIPKLCETKDGEFRILQLSDFHFTENLGECRDQVTKDSACNASPKTLNFIHQVLDRESPNLVVITGDILDGFHTFDYQTAILKALSPIISRSIPFAVALGENDKNQFAPRYEIIEFLASLPFSMMSLTEKTDFEQVTNYVLPVHNAQNEVIDAIYILDIYSEASKEQALKYLKGAYDNLPSEPTLSIEFQHLPIQEYRPKTAFAIVGAYNEKGKLKSKTDSQTRQILSDVGVQTMSVGSEHANECCILNDGKQDELQPLWMCFGGSVGEGAYNDGKQDRKVRLFDLKSKSNEITTWKRKQSDPHSVFDYQFILS